MNPQLESIKKQALAINDTLNTKAAAEGKATQTFDAAGRATRVPPSTNIPVAAIENTSPAPVQVPPVSFDPNQSLQSALTASEQVFEGERVRSEQELAAASNKESATDARLKELFGVMGQAPQVKKALEDQQGLEQKKRIVNQITAKAGLVADDLDLFKLNTEAVSRQNELEASKRDFTKGTFSAADTRMRTERALEANARASELVGLRAQYAIAEGNVTLANEAVAQAMDIFYKPIEMELELEKKFFDRNTSRMNEAQRSAADVRLKQAEARGAEIRDAKALVSEAVSTGYASANDIAAMTKLSGDPEAQSIMAQSVIAKAARAERVSSISGSTINVPGGGEPITVPTFDEWINAKQEEALQTFSPQKREQMKEEYYAEMEVVKQQDTLSRLSPLAAEVVRNPKAFFDLTPTMKGDILTELSTQGIDTKLIQEGKRRPLTATQADDLIQARIARDGIIELNRKLSELEATGPVIGGVRRLNPYDPQVVAIMAEITRIVPGLARGIYK